MSESLSHDDEVPLELIVDRVRSRGATTRVTRVSMTGGKDSDEPAARKSFVLVGGVGVAATYFEFLAPTLAELGDVYALDLPGFAGLPRPHEQPTAAFFAEQVSAVLDHYGLDDPVLIGHSMGTQVVIELLIDRPGITEAVLVSPVINDQERALPLQALRFAQSASRETLHLALTAFSAYLLCGLVYFLTVLPHMMRYRVVDRVALVQARLLLIRGQLDTTSPRRFHARLARAARSASTWEIEGAAHSVINAHAVGVAKLTVGFVDGRLARRGGMSSEEADLPEPVGGGVSLVLKAMGSRAAEWVSALRRDERGVARAKAEHAKLLWRAYAPRRR
ncbi:alpha/beta fold hydrolase [Herbiconiux sp. A18JL235]|uniref:Alpha/beta fold hydrolase n=1 Tax=Herbiconiux sp. A18JL235 TaxID=3152363 RepID=A0AB39BJQ7_9MICO